MHTNPTEFKVTDEHPTGAWYRRVPGGDGEEQVSPFSSVLIAFFWTIVSTTTLKQADLTVSSPASCVISVFLAYCQIVMLALLLCVHGFCTFIHPLYITCVCERVDSLLVVGLFTYTPTHAQLNMSCNRSIVGRHCRRVRACNAVQVLSRY